MAMLLSDEDSQGIGYFALLTTPSDSFSNYDFEQAGAAPIELAQIPRPSIVGSVSTGPATGVELVVRVSDVEQTPQHGFFLDPDCGAGSPVLYRVRKQQLPEGSVPPQSRDVGEWQDTGQIVEAGADAHVMISCASDEDEYLAVSVVTDSGFETQVVGPNSGRIECGPNLADPRPRRRQRARPSRTE